MPVIANQGYRKDLNLVEGVDDSATWNNLYQAGLSNDLAVLRNNLRNTSNLGISSLTLDTSAVGLASFFTFQQSSIPPYTNGEPREVVYTNDDVVGFSHTVTFGTGAGSTTVAGGSSPNYYVCSSNGLNKFKISVRASNESVGAGLVVGVSTIHEITSYPPETINGRAWASSGSIIGFAHDGRTDLSRSGSSFTNVPGSGGTGSGALWNVSNSGGTIEFANDGADPTGKAIGANYRVGDEISIPATSVGGGADIKITVTDVQDFRIIRKDPVIKNNLTNFIPPDVQDDSGFSWLGGTIVSVFDSTASNSDTADYFIGQKYKSNGDTTTSKDIKLEGSSTVADPANSNTSQGNIDSSDSPGVFIGATRAFSSDNNPWEKSGTAGASDATLLSQTYQASIGELEFRDDIEITGISQVSVTASTLGSYSPGTKDLWKVPVVINGETYFLLLDQAT